MKTFSVLAFAEDGTLDDLDGALFLAKKLGCENALDFTGVIKVSDEFLDVLLQNQVLESLDGRILGQEGLVEKALAAWVKRQALPVVEPPSYNNHKAKILVSRPKSLEYERSEPEGEKYTPTRLIKRLQQQLMGYIESAYPLSDPILVRSRRHLLRESRNGHLLAQEPFVESTPKYMVLVPIDGRSLIL